MIQNISFAPNRSSSFAQTEQKAVVIDGKTYPVKKVQGGGIGKTLLPVYNDVVVIDGKQYKVTDTWAPCDMKGQEVVVNGKRYNVMDQSQATLKAGAQNIIKSIFDK